MLKPLPQVVHSLSAVQAALRQMSQARHVGKIVVRAPTGEAAKSAPAGTVVVTGGLGTLGSLTAAWVAQNSKLRVHATARTGRFTADVGACPSGSLAALVAAGFAGLLSMTSADAAVAEDAALLMSASAASVVGVLHASGVLADATLRNQTLQGLRTSWAPKVAALQQLSGALGRQPGSFQLLFSSIAALLGSPGQANYSAANAALDAMAQAAQAEVGCWQDAGQIGARCIACFYKHTTCACRLTGSPHCPLPPCLQGLASISVQWGAWAGAGMAGHDSSTRARVERTGLGLVESEAGLAALEGLLLQAAAAAPAQAAAVPIRWPKFLQQQFKGTPPAMFAAFADQAAPAGAAAAPVAAAAASSRSRSGGQRKQRSSRPAAARSSAEHEAFVLGQVQEAVAAVLGSADISASEPLMAAGLDSLSAVELRNSLEATLGAELPTTLVFDYPTMAAIAGYLASKIQPGAGSAGEAGSGTSLTDSEAEYEAAAVPSAAVARRRRRSSAPSRRQRGQVSASAAAAGSAAAGVSVSAEAHRAFMLGQVQQAVAAVLGRADIDAQEPLMAAGLDSLSSVELRNSLEGKLGAELPTTLVFDCPTMAALAGFLASKIQPGGAGAELAAAADSASDSDSYSSEASYSWDEEGAGSGMPASLALPRQRARQVVAVTGMVVRAPGDALAVIQPVDAVQLVPASRWNLEAHAGVLIFTGCACWGWAIPSQCLALLLLFPHDAQP